MDRIDDTYFAKYRGSGAGLNSVASAATSAGQNMEGKASGENVEGKASDKASSVGSTASKDIEVGSVRGHRFTQVPYSCFSWRKHI